MDDASFDGIKQAYESAPSSALAKVIVQELISRGDMDAAGDFYRAAIADDPGMQDDDWNALFGISSQDGAEENRRKIKVVEKPDMADVVTLDRFREETTDFNDVVGLDKIKKQISKKIILPFQKPSLFERFRKKIGGGVLLFGACQFRSAGEPVLT